MPSLITDICHLSDGLTSSSSSCRPSRLRGVIAAAAAPTRVARAVLQYTTAFGFERRLELRVASGILAITNNSRAVHAGLQCHERSL